MILGETLSQAEIDALLKGINPNENNNKSNNGDTFEKREEEIELTKEEIDVLGEIGNISIGTSATTLFALLGHKVLITTPKVNITTWENLAIEYPLPYVAVKVEYTKGLKGTNLLIIKEDDVKVMTSLMLNDGGESSKAELSDLHLSAISEAMNQMVGSSATSMSYMFQKRIEISPPKSFIIKFDSSKTYDDFKTFDKLVKISFKMVVEGFIDSEIMQLLPIDFAKELVNNLYEISKIESNMESVNNTNNIKEDVHNNKTHNSKSHSTNQTETNRNTVEKETPIQNNSEPVNVQPINFPLFDEENKVLEKHDITFIMDIPLEVTVELGKTQKLIKEILGFGYGTIIELDKLAGDPVDILVNGKKIAKGEVVVIDDNFGVRITDIVQPSKRI